MIRHQRPRRTWYGAALAVVSLAAGIVCRSAFISETEVFTGQLALHSEWTELNLKRPLRRSHRSCVLEVETSPSLLSDTGRSASKDLEHLKTLDFEARMRDQTGKWHVFSQKALRIRDRRGVILIGVLPEAAVVDRIEFRSGENRSLSHSVWACSTE